MVGGLELSVGVITYGQCYTVQSYGAVGAKEWISVRAGQCCVHRWWSCNTRPFVRLLRSLDAEGFQKFLVDCVPLSPGGYYGSNINVAIRMRQGVAWRMPTCRKLDIRVDCQVLLAVGLWLVSSVQFQAGCNIGEMNMPDRRQEEE